MSLEWRKNMVEINRLLSKKAIIAYKKPLADKSLRRARARTLIQALC